MTHAPRRANRRLPRQLSALAWGIIALVLAAGLAPDVFAAAPSPTVVLAVPATPLVGSSIQINATFSDANDTGYGPYIDLVLPQQGADGASTPPNNGVSFTGATYLGSTVTSSVQTIPVGGCVTEPYAYQASGAHAILCGLPAGEQFVSLQLPFGSFTSAQPQAKVLVSAAVSNRARVGTALTISAHGGFTYGADALQNPAADPTITGTTTSATTTPSIMTVSGTFIAPETETASGPEFPRQYRVDVTVAPGQTLTNLDVSANLPANLQYVSFGSSSPASSAIATPPTATPDGTLTRRFASVTGTGGVDATFIFTFNVPRLDAGSSAVISPTTGAAAASQIDNTATGSWTPVDFPRQPVATPSATSTSGALADRSIAIQSGLAIATDASPLGLSPNDDLTWSLPFQVSDFFAFKDVVVNDVLRDGTTFSTSPAPRISLSGNGFAIVNQPIEPAYYTAVLQADGTTVIEFDVSVWLAAHGFGANIVGGCVLPTGSAADCVAHANGAVSGTITFGSVVDTSFHVPQPAGHDQFLDQGDIISNAASISGTVLANTTLVSTGNTASNGNASVSSPGTTSQGQIAVGTLAKSIYAINGVLGPGSHIRAGDVVTYRLLHSMPISTSESYGLTDYLPLPIFSATSITTFDPTVSAAAPPSGTAKFGPTDTFGAYAGIDPTLSSSASANSVTFAYGNVQATPATKQTDLLFSVTVSTDPFADGLFLTNQVQSTEGSTNGTTTVATAIVAVTLDEPQINAIAKGAIASSNGAAIFTPATVLPAGVTASAPGGACPRLTGAVTSAGIGATPIASDVANVMAGDRTTFAITVENTGHAAAFDINVADVIPAGYQAPAGGINLCVRNGAGTAIAFTGSEATFVTPAGITLADGASGALAAGQNGSNVVNATGTNIALITFDLEIATSVNPLNQITNTASLAGYTSSDGGPNFVPAGLTDQALTMIATPAIAKSLTATSLANTAGSAVNIGEVATFTTILTVPAGTIPSATVTDTLPANLAFVGCTSVVSSSAQLTSSIGAFTGACTPPTNPTVGAGGTPVVFTLGTLTNTSGTAQTITLTYTAVATNVATNVNGTNLVSVATLGYTNAAGPQTLSSSPAVGVAVVEPRPTVTTLSDVTVGEAGTVVTYTTTIAKGTSTSDGFDASLAIPLPAGMTYVSGSILCAGAQVTTSCAFAGNTGTVTWATFVNSAAITTITYSATIDATVVPATVLNLTTALTWTSLPGAPGQISTFNALSFERTGVLTDPGLAANTYRATSLRTVTTNVPVATKLQVTSSEAASGGNSLLVGEIVRYRLVATIPAGSSPNASITDVLPTGLQFINDGTARIAFVTNGGGMTTTDGPLTACAGLNVAGSATTVVAIGAASVVCVVPSSNITGGPFSAGTAPVFTLGSLTNNDRDLDVESVVIDLNALVLNVAANVNAAVIPNQARITDNAVAYNSVPFTQTVISPTVTAVKTILTAPTQAGSSAVYQVVITNTSGFSTFDVHFTDTLPASLIVDSHAITSGTAPDADTSAGNTIDMVWNTLTTGQTMTVRVNAHVDPLATSALKIANTATVTWTTLPGTNGTTSNPTGSPTPGAPGTTTGERTGSGVAPNDLTNSSTVSTTLTAPSIAKTGSPATIAIGDIVTYNLVTRLAEGTTKALVVTDSLPVNVTYMGSTLITTAAASGGLLAADFGGTLAVPVIAAPPGGSVTFTFGDTVNPADAVATNDRFLIRVTARVRNVAPTNIRGVVITNPASVGYTDPNTSTAASASAPTPATSTVIEPRLSVAESVLIPAVRNEAGGVVTYRILVSAHALSNATAYDAALTATIPAGMTYVPASISCTTGTITPATCSITGQTLSASWATFPTGAATTIITYQATFDTTVTPSQALTHSSALTWQSLPTDATNPDIRTGANGAAGTPNNYATSSQVTSTILAQTIAKALTSTSEASTPGSNLAIGEVATYRLTVALPEGTTPSLSILDNLPVGLDYVAGSATVDATGFNGTLPVPTITAPGGSGADVTLAFGSTSVVADGNVANDSFTITLQAKVLDIAGNIAGVVRPNSATATVSAGTPVASNTVNATIVEPHLTSTLVPSTTTPAFSTAVTYTYTLSHAASTSDANDIVVTVTIPATITATPGSASAPAGWTVDETGLPSTLRFTKSVLTQVTASAVFTWVAMTPGVGGTTIGTTSLTSVATTWTSLAGVMAGERTGTGGVDNYVTNASATVTLSGPDLHITNMTDGGITATPGSLVPYVISYRNDGNVTATGIVLTATVPANAIFDTAGSSAGWSCANAAPGGSVCTNNLPALGASAALTRTFAVRPVTPWGVGVAKLLSVTSSIADDGTHGPDPTANNTGADTTPVSATPDLTTTITDGKLSTLAGATDDYTVVVNNVGHQDAAGVVISMTVPTRTTFNAGASTAGWACVGTACTFPVGGLAGNGGSSTVHFIVAVDDPLAPNLATIVATDSVADDGTGGADPTPANNTATDSDTVPLIDLSVALAGGLAHQGIPYVITATISNGGPASATVVLTHVALPAGLTYVSDDGAGAYVGGTGTWTVGTLASGATRTLHITVMPTAVGSPIVSTEVTHAAQSDVDSTPANGSTTEDDDDSLTVTVAPTADLGVTKSADLPNVEVGDTVVFTVSVTNAGPNTAANVTVADALPAGLTYVSDDGAGAYAAGTWTIGPLTNGASATLHITATASTLGTKTNTATASSPTFDPALSDNTASAGVHARSSDIAVTKVRIGPIPNYLGNVTYTITASNLGQDASTVAVTDLLPAGLLYVSDDAGGAYHPLTGVWDVGTLASGASAVLTVTAQDIATGTISNTATVTHEDHFDPNLANNTSTATMTVAPGVDDSVTITADDTTPLFHQTVTFTVTAHNDGPDTAANSVVNVPMPAGLTYVGDNGGGAYVPGTGTWTLGGLLAGETRVIFISAQTVTTGTIHVPATIGTSTFDHDLSNNADEEVLTVPNSSDLSVVKTVNNAAPHNTETVIFSITVQNAGPDSATGQVSDLLPAGLAYVSDDSAGGAYVPGTGTLALGTLASGGSFTFHISARATTTGPITNTATVFGPQHDVDPTNNTASATVTVSPAADVSTTISPSDATPDVGDAVVLTITAHNAGPDAALGTVLTAILPAGLSYVSDDAGGAYVPGTGAWTLGTLNSGATSTLHLVVTVTAPGSIVIPVSVSSATFDPNLANNVASTTLTVPSADLAVTKTVTDTTPDYLGTITFTVTVHNAGPDAAHGASVADLLPAGLAWISDDGAGAYVHGTGHWTIGTLASGASATLHVVARVTATGTTVNHATVSAATFDPDLANNAATRSIDVASATDISAQIIVDDATPDVGQHIDYTVTIHNAGPDDATGTSAAIVLPAGLTYVNDDGGGAYNPVTGTLTIGNLPAGASVVLVIGATPNAPGSIALGVHATSATFDPDLTNNTDSVSVTVPVADLVVTKSVSDATPDYLKTTVFTVTVRNAGPDDSLGVVLHDPLPAGLTYVGDDSGGSYNQANGHWTIGTLAHGAVVHLHITVRATTTGAHVNTASVTAITFDPTSANNADTATVTVAPAGDVSITKTVDNLTPNVGDVVTFTVTVHNAGPDTAAGVSVVDMLPAGLTYLSDDGAGAYDPVLGVWTIGSLASGGDIVLHVSATVTASGTFANSATVSATTYDQDLTNNTATTAPTAPLAADLKVSNAVSDPTPSLHDVVTYTVVVGNNGPDTGTAVEVAFPLPAGFSWVSDDASGAYDHATGTWTIGSLAKGDSVTLVVHARVIANGTLTTTAIVSGGIYDPVAANDIDSATLTVLTADLGVTKTVDVASPDYLGTVVFTIVATNHGPSDASGVTIDDALPAGLTYVSDDAGGDYNNGTGVWTVGALANGASTTLHITARVSATGTTANDVAVGSLEQLDPNGTNDGAQAVITVADAADIAVAIGGTNTDANVGESVSLVITVTNHGPDAAAGVVLDNVFPSNLTFVSDDGGGAYVPATGVWTIGSIPAGASVTLTIAATAATVGNSSDDATATTTTFEADLTNNDATRPVTVHPTADLSLTKTADEPIPHNGTDITYTVSVRNDGPNSATGVEVGDLLPAGLSYVSDDGAGAYVPGSGIWTIGTILNGEDAVLHITAKVVTTGSVANTGQVHASSVHDPDSTPANDDPLEDDQATATVNGQAAADLSVTDSVVVLTGNAGSIMVPAVNLGGTVRFTIDTANAGPDGATGVTTRFLLPAGLQYVSDDGAGMYDPGTGIWTIGDLGQGATTSLHVVARAILTGATSGVAELTAALEWDPDSSPANGVVSEDDQASAPLDVPPAAALTITKTASVAQVARNGQVTFTLAVHNAGPDTATNVVVVDALPAGMTFIGSDGGAAFDRATRTWTIPSIADGATATLHLTVKVTVIGTIQNVATLRGGDQFDPNAGAVLASARASVKVVAGPDDRLPFTDLDPTDPIVLLALALLAGLAFIGWGTLRRRSRRASQIRS